MTYAHILVPTDGTDSSRHAIDEAIELAKQSGARITGFHAIEELPAASGLYLSMADLRDRMTYPERAGSVAREYLAVIEQSAAAKGVPCRTYFTMTAKHPHQAIIDAAEENACDLIVMGTHGRTGIGALMLGSETRKVLTHSTIPVLVTH